MIDPAMEYDYLQKHRNSRKLMGPAAAKKGAPAELTPETPPFRLESKQNDTDIDHHRTSQHRTDKPGYHIIHSDTYAYNAAQCVALW